MRSIGFVIITALALLWSISLMTGCGAEAGGVLHVDPPPGDPLITKSTRDLVESNVPVGEAASDIEARFFARSADYGFDAAVDELDLALADVLQSESKLEALVERSTALAGRILDPDEAEQRGAIANEARTSSIARDSARMKLLELAQRTGISCPSSESDTTVIFVNGIAVTYVGYLLMVADLREEVKEAGLDDVRVTGVYNVSSRDSERSVFGKFICPAIGLASRAREAVTNLCRESGLFVDFAEAASQWEPFALFGSTPATATGNTVGLRDSIISEVQSGRSVILVAHSQGNFFARDALNELGTDVEGRPYAESVGVIEVASPAWSMPGFSVRVDICEDPIPVLSPRMSRVGSCSDCCIASRVGTGLDAHSFRDSYLPNSTARTRIIEAIESYKSILTNPRSDLGSGVIQVTLTWNNTSDIDLHVTEPSGAHVYFGDRQGDFGTLDRDDTDGFGPENYYICTELEVGSGAYQIDVRHFAGASPTNVTLQIKAGSSIQTYTGTVGDSDLIGVASVTYDDGYFSIR